MSEPASKQWIASTILLRVAAILFILLGVGILFATYIAVTAHPIEATHPTRVVVPGICIVVIGFAAILRKRWAVILMSAAALAFGVFVTWGAAFHVPLPWGIFLGAFYLAVAFIPAVCAYCMARAAMNTQASNQPMQPTAGRRTALLSMTKTHSFQIMLALASGGSSCSR